MSVYARGRKEWCCRFTEVKSREGELNRKQSMEADSYTFFFKGLQ